MKVVLLTKEECGLCREAEAVLLRLRKKIRFELERVDIEADEALHSRYWDKVPVVVVGGEELGAPLDERRLRALLTV